MVYTFDIFCGIFKKKQLEKKRMEAVNPLKDPITARVLRTLNHLQTDEIGRYRSYKTRPDFWTKFKVSQLDFQ